MQTIEVPASARRVDACSPRCLGRRGSLFVSAGVVAHTLWTSAAPAMSYALYAREWHLSHTVTSRLFAIYPIVLVAVLVGFGEISDHIGRRTTMLAGLAASLAGAVLFGVAPNVLWLFAGRALMGVGVGLAAGPSTAAVSEFSMDKRGTGVRSNRAARITTVAQATGFAAALLIGGALTEYAPSWTGLPFWVLTTVLALLFAATWFMPRGRRSSAGNRWHPRIPSVPKSINKPFAVASIAMVTAYVHGVLVLSLGGQIAHDLFGSTNAFRNGAVLSVFPIVLGLVGVLARRLLARTSMIGGASASAVSMALLAASFAVHSLSVFLLATAMAGAGYSLLFLSALEIMNHAAPAGQRGGVLSALYLLAYLSMGIVAMVLGAVATDQGLDVAVNFGAGTIAALSIATAGAALAMRAFPTDPRLTA